MKYGLKSAGGFGKTKYLWACRSSSSSDRCTINRTVEALRESRRSSASSLRDVRPVAYRCGSYCETSSIVGSLKYVRQDRWDPWTAFVPEHTAYVPRRELACSSSRRDLTRIASESLCG